MSTVEKILSQTVSLDKSPLTFEGHPICGIRTRLLWRSSALSVRLFSLSLLSYSSLLNLRDS